MLDRALLYRAVIDEVCKDKQLRQYEIEETEWAALANLRDLLKVHTVQSVRVGVGVVRTNGRRLRIVSRRPFAVSS